MEGFFGEDVAKKLVGSHNATSLTSGWLTQAASTPINETIGPNRRFDGTKIALSDIKIVRTALGGTVNDVVIAAVAGAVRSFLLEDRVFAVDGVDFRAMVPVSIRDEAGVGELGNHITMWLVDLPIAEPDPVEQSDEQEVSE